MNTSAHAVTTTTVTRKHLQNITPLKSENLSCMLHVTVSLPFFGTFSLHLCNNFFGVMLMASVLVMMYDVRVYNDSILIGFVY